MTSLYHQAKKIIKAHVNAGPDDILLFTGSGMTAAINKFQRLIGLKVQEKYIPYIKNRDIPSPLVIITHMEHHSNHTSWLECLCNVEIINRGKCGRPSLKHMEEILKINKGKGLLIGSFSACSNVTGIHTDYYKMAALMHKYGGYCFVDFAASAPYVRINMHPGDPAHTLDAIFFSPHKFLGGPGSPGIVIFNKKFYNNNVPDHPGGGTVKWTNPWGKHSYLDDIERREDGGTPGFLQGIKAALAILLKEEIGIEAILAREEVLKETLFSKLIKNPEIHILEQECRERLGIISFYSPGRHHNLIVKLLNDYFGIQTRGGCSCAGTYGHILLNVDKEQSARITKKIEKGDLSEKPGWVRISIHPTMQDREIHWLADCVNLTIKHYDKWAEEYYFNPPTGEFFARDGDVSLLKLESSLLK
jgi:selenocysteine lyase/cysteine desulfurase